MKIFFVGIVECGDAYRGGACDDGIDCAVQIAGEDVVDEIHERAWGPDVRAILNDEVVARGAAVSEVGSSYSEYTPIDSDKAEIGGVDLIELLGKHEHKVVSLTITDDPEELP